MTGLSKDSIIFPGLNITLSPGQGISLFGFNIAYYGMIIALGMVIAAVFIQKNAARYGENPDTYFDMTYLGIIGGVVGARAYYVIFAWEFYKDNILSIFNLRNGGLAIFGGIIGGAITVFVFSKIKKLSFLKSGDIVMPGVIIGQILGRWGNFFNREAFGDYSGGLFRMGLPVEGVRSASDITEKMREHIEIVDGIDFIFVHPTFLYESFFNLCTLILMLLVSRRKRGNGEVLMTYLLCYGVSRFFIERLRTDQLLLPGLKVPVSMVVAFICVILSGMIFLYNRKKVKLQ